MADWNLPTNLSNYTTVLDEIKQRDVDTATMNYDTSTNIPDGTIRWNSSNNRFEKWDSVNGVWNALNLNNEVVSPLVLKPEDENTGEGGDITFSSTGTYETWHTDVYQDRFRIWHTSGGTGGNVRLSISSSTGKIDFNNTSGTNAFSFDANSGSAYFVKGSGDVLLFDSDVSYTKKITVNDGAGNFNIVANWSGTNTHIIDGGACRITLHYEGVDGSIKLRASNNQLSGTTAQTSSYFEVTQNQVLVQGSLFSVSSNATSGTAVDLAHFDNASDTGLVFRISIAEDFLFVPKQAGTYRWDRELSFSKDNDLWFVDDSFGAGSIVNTTGRVFEISCGSNISFNETAVTIGAGVFVDYVAEYNIIVPAGKSLVIRRIRSYNYASDIRWRLFFTHNQTTYTTGSQTVDSSVNYTVYTNTGTTDVAGAVIFQLYNAGTIDQAVNSRDNIYVLFEII